MRPRAEALSRQSVFVHRHHLSGEGGTTRAQEFGLCKPAKASLLVVMRGASSKGRQGSTQSRCSKSVTILARIKSPEGGIG